MPSFDPEKTAIPVLPFLNPAGAPFPMQDKADEYGILYTNKPPYEILCSKWLSYQDVLRLKRIEEMVICKISKTIDFLQSGRVGRLHADLVLSG